MPEHNQRIADFKTAFAAALETARPLVDISNATLSIVYGDSAPRYGLILTELPFADGTPAHKAAYDVLISNGLSKEAEHQRRTWFRVDIFSYLSDPYEPVVFDSLMAQLQLTMRSPTVTSDSFGVGDEAVPCLILFPSSPTVRRTMVRGWWEPRSSSGKSKMTAARQ